MLQLKNKGFFIPNNQVLYDKIWIMWKHSMPNIFVPSSNFKRVSLNEEKLIHEMECTRDVTTPWKDQILAYTDNIRAQPLASTVFSYFIKGAGYKLFPTFSSTHPKKKDYLPAFFIVKMDNFNNFVVLLLVVVYASSDEVRTVLN